MTNEVLYDSRNRVKRTNDERLYQPAIHSERIRQLHELAVLTGQPLTWLVDCALREYYFSMLDWLDSHEVINAVPEETP